MKKREKLAWILAVIWIGVIFTGIPQARKIQSLVETFCGRGAFTYIVFGALAVCTLCGIRHIHKPQNSIKLASWGWLILIAAVFFSWTIKLRGNPEESFHFIEYGMLSILIFWALSFRVQDASVYFTAFFLASIIGSLDEVVQWLLPERYFDYRDIGLNSGSAALALIALAKVWRPRIDAFKSGTSSWLLAYQAAALQLLILLCCLMNTPGVVLWIANSIPPLAYLKSKNNFMTEYGYRHLDAKIGSFYSRFTPNQLQEMDRSRAEEVGATLNRHSDISNYNSFLRTYTPLSDPFIHEIRVRIFRRDEYLDKLHHQRPGSSLIKPLCTVAWRENQLLEKYFGKSLKHTVFKLSVRRADGLAQCADPSFAYESPVSGNLITSFSLPYVYAATVLLLLVLWRIQRLAK